MTSRYFFRTFRRLLLLSSSHIPRNNRLLWTSVGSAAIIGTTIYKISPFEKLTSSFIVHAKALEKDLSPTGMKIISFFIKVICNYRKTILSSCT